MGTPQVRLPAETFARVVRLTPLVSIDLVVRDARGAMLVGWRRNRPAQDAWFVPGGRIGKDERIAAAFARLTLDELGVTLPLDSARFLGVFEHLYADNFAGEDGYGTHYVVLAYECIVTNPLPLPEAQHARYRWMTDAELLANAEVHPNTKAYARPAA